MAKSLNLIVACAENRVIGREGRLPFDIPEDKEWFHQRTAGQTVVLGRICFETWPRVLLDGRAAVVITANAARVLADATRRFGSAATDSLHVCATVAEALDVARKLPGEIMICGGERIYEETLPIADRIVLTLVHAEVTGDRHFPDWRGLPWEETWRREGRDQNFRYTFSILERRR